MIVNRRGIFVNNCAYKMRTTRIQSDAKNLLFDCLYCTNKVADTLARFRLARSSATRKQVTICKRHRSINRLVLAKQTVLKTAIKSTLCTAPCRSFIIALLVKLQQCICVRCVRFIILGSSAIY